MDEPKAATTIEDKYGFVFGGPLGREVLADILGICGWGSSIVDGDPFAVAGHNLALEILKKCGVLEGGREQLIQSMLGSRRPPPG